MTFVDVYDDVYAGAGVGGYGDIYSDIYSGGTGHVFTPPTINDVPPINPDSEGLPYRLMRHYGNRSRGINVWKLADGTYTTTQPYPLVTPQDQKEGNLPIGDANQVTYLRVYYGGHSYHVDATEAAALTAAGYGAMIS